MLGMGRTLAVALATLACAASWSAVAAAVPLPTTAAPLPGSTFQGADGDQLSPPALTDWQALQAQPGRVTSVPDANDQDTAFTGGSKENAPGAWDIETSLDGVTPGQSNILHAWYSIDQAGTPPNIFLYTASLREQAGGTSFLAVELNQIPGLWNNGHADIPCRSTGDLQVVFEVQGNTASANVERWTTGTPDVVTGCARTGSFEDATGLVANTDLQAAWNAAQIQNFLPGSGTAIAPALFGEAALNLTRILGAFGQQCFSFGSVWMHSRSSDSDQAQMKDFVGPQALSARTCTASGTKFEDLNANGVHDAGEPGLKNVVIFADYDRDGLLDDNEPRTTTDKNGDYRIEGITRLYDLREKLIDSTATAGWTCSSPLMTFPVPLPFPCGYAGLDPTLSPNETGRDFLNFLPSRLTVRKELSPSDDPGRFVLNVAGGDVDQSSDPVGDGGQLSLSGLRPGTYTVTETAAPGTDPATHTSTLTCASVVRETLDDTVRLSSGEDVECVFRNVRNGSPGIAIVKRGPATAEQGERLRYRLRVRNIGDVPFAADQVKVTDPRCDAPPRLVAKRRAGAPDPSPGTLDPGDVWVYRCSRQTRPPGDPECSQREIINRATVTGTVDGADFTSRSRFPTLLTCPDLPPVVPPDPNPEPEPEPGPGEGVRPVPPVPPDPPGSEPRGAVEAADSVPFVVVRGRASTSMRRGCVTRRARLQVIATRPILVAVSVDGRVVKRIRPIPLSGKYLVILSARRLSPGRHRVAVRVVYERGSGTSPLVLRRRLTVCARVARFTG